MEIRLTDHGALVYLAGVKGVEREDPTL